MEAKDRVYQALCRMSKSDCQITAAALAEELNLSRQVVSHYLNRLLEEGCVEKTLTRPVCWNIRKQQRENVQGSVSEERKEIEEVLPEVRREDVFDAMIGADGSQKNVIERCKAAVSYPPDGLPILITGESGVGKSFLARLIHQYAISRAVIRESAPLVVLNCADYANNPELLSAALLGYKKGSFTGADTDKEGLLQEADGGYLFLDEVHRLSYENQEKLFVFMDTGRYRPLGDKNWKAAKVRFIFATTEVPEKVLLETFRRRITVQTSIGSIAERPLMERLQLIYRFYQKEAVKINKDPANKHHECLNPEGVGSMLRTKINVNLGVSRDCKDYNIEMQKVMSAVNMGAEAIMDLSSHGNTQPFRQKLTHECPVMIGTVPVYDSVIHYQRDLAELTAQDFIDVVRLHAEDGVDFVTLHCGITRKTIEQIRKHKRKMNIVSRGGSLVFAWMSMTGNENPFYEHFDEICEICAEHDVTISLGDACRPGCLADATDVCQIEELVRLGELTKRAWAHNVQVMVEGPGHVPLNQVAANMEVQKSICMGAPFYVLGPLVTDIAPGYDHITAAIGGAVAAASGAAFLCYVTPAEHLALPNVDDVKQGIVASKIAAHAADIAKGIPHARDIDDKMGDARRVLDWDAQFACALDPETAKAIRDARLPEDDHSDTCSMCGKFCAVRSMNKALAGEYIDIL